MSENSEEAIEDVVEKNQGTTEPEENTDNEISLLENNPIDPPAMIASKKWPNKKLIAIAAATAAFVIAVILSLTVFSPQANADRLYKQGSYAEALETYKTINSKSNETKMKDCRYWLFVDYLLTAGPFKTSEGGVTWTVEGFSNGDIKVSVSGDVTGNYNVGMESSWVITIHHGETSADFSASEKWKVFYRTMSDSGSGKIDLPSYFFGKEITLDEYENSGTTAGVSFIKSNSGVVSKMIQKGIRGALAASGTDTSLADLGFSGLS